jgi:hypothetical protein
MVRKEAGYRHIPHLAGYPVFFCFLLGCGPHWESVNHGLFSTDAVRRLTASYKNARPYLRDSVLGIQ